MTQQQLIEYLLLENKESGRVFSLAATSAFEMGVAEGQQGRFELANLVLDGQPYRASSDHRREADRPDGSVLVVTAGGDGDQAIVSREK